MPAISLVRTAPLPSIYGAPAISRPSRYTTREKESLLRTKRKSSSSFSQHGRAALESAWRILSDSYSCTTDRSNLNPDQVAERHSAWSCLWYGLPTNPRRSCGTLANRSQPGIDECLFGQAHALASLPSWPDFPS